MKIIFLNVWMAKAEKPFYEFLKKHSKTTDVFCFSEVTNGNVEADFGNFLGDREVGRQYKKIVRQPCSNVFPKIQKSLPSFVGYFENSEDFKTPTGMSVPMGLACFVKRGLSVKKSVNVVNTSRKVPHCFERIMQTIMLKQGKNKVWISSLHGVSQPGSKLDTRERLQQSRNICKVLSKQKGKRILGGDFNLMPNTKSVRLIEEFGMKNLIKDFGIDETRSRISHSQFPNDKQHFADFAFVSKDVEVKSFKVPKVNISDHLPLILEIED